jgi:uncharacterized protein (TIGR00255 family)
MIKSMTGYGKATSTDGGRTLVVEIRSLNSKQMDTNTRISRVFKEKESEIRSIISKELERGKIDIAIYYENEDAGADTAINKSLLLKYYRELKSISDEADNNLPSDHFALAMRMPDVLSTSNLKLSDEEWKNFLPVLNEAIAQLNEFRRHEGEILGNDTLKRINIILQLLVETETFEKKRMDTIKERIQKNLNELIGVDKTDKNRFEEELIYYLEKIDITEEKLRLKKHCDYFVETMNQPEANGRKLVFISQEIGREINTIGSKANDADIQKLVIQMKDELEKIKEQLLNIL